MTTIHRTRQPVEVATDITRPRITPPPTSRQFAETLGEGAHSVLRGVEQAAGLLPGGTAVTAAIRGGGEGASVAAGVGTASTSGVQAPTGGEQASMQGMMESSSTQALQLLQLQQQIAMEQRQFQTVSNVLKARHDTSKAVIQNVR